MTWHQWHHTASRSRITKRFSAAARANRSSPQLLQLGPSAADNGDAASAAMAKAAMRTSFMAAPGALLLPELRAQKNPGSDFPRCHGNVRPRQVDNQVDSQVAS